MRAVTVNRFGELPQVVDVTTPAAGPGQVLIKLVAASMNPMDRKLASGAWRPAPVCFPMVLGVDGAGLVEAVGEGTTRFVPGDKVFGQLFIPPVGAFGTYAEYVAVTADAPLARVPKGLDLIRAASAPTAGGAGLSLVELLEPLDDQIVLIIGAGGAVGTFASQFAVNAGASVFVNVNAEAAERMRSYGVTRAIFRSAESVADAIHQTHPDGVDVLIDLVSDAKAFAARATLVRAGGSAVTTQYVADLEALRSRGIRGVNFALRQTSELLQKVADSLAARTVIEPPITRITLDDVPSMFGPEAPSGADRKTVIVM
jgi:NADPH:quinone reductase